MAATDRDLIAETTRVVMNWLAKSPKNDAVLRTTNDDGLRPVLVALEDELFSTVLHRLSWTGGPYANLFVRMNDGGIVSGALMPPESAIDDTAKHEFDSEFHRDVSMGEIVKACASLQSGVNVSVQIDGTRTDVAMREPNSRDAQIAAV